MTIRGIAQIIREQLNLAATDENTEKCIQQAGALYAELVRREVLKRGTQSDSLITLSYRLIKGKYMTAAKSDCKVTATEVIKPNKIAGYPPFITASCSDFSRMFSYADPTTFGQVVHRFGGDISEYTYINNRIYVKNVTSLQYITVRMYPYEQSAYVDELTKEYQENDYPIESGYVAQLLSMIQSKPKNETVSSQAE